MSKFGWSYPPGAANDPHAPYNQDAPAITMLKEKTLHARKEHLCDMCQTVIPKGEAYRYFAFVDYDNCTHDGKGKLLTSHQHIVCPHEEEWP